MYPLEMMLLSHGNPSLETSRNVPGLKPGQTYFFRVMAQNANGWSEPAEMDLPLRVEAASSELIRMRFYFSSPMDVELCCYYPYRAAEHAECSQG